MRHWLKPDHVTFLIAYAFSLLSFFYGISHFPQNYDGAMLAVINSVILSMLTLAFIFDILEGKKK